MSVRVTSFRASVMQPVLTLAVAFIVVVCDVEQFFLEETELTPVPNATVPPALSCRLRNSGGTGHGVDGHGRAAAGQEGLWV